MHLTGGSLRVFKQFPWLEVGSVKLALPRPTHQRVSRKDHTGRAASRWAFHSVNNRKTISVNNDLRNQIRNSMSLEETLEKHYKSVLDGQ